MVDQDLFIQSINEAITPFNLAYNHPLELERYETSNIFKIKYYPGATSAYNNYPEGGDYIKVMKWFNDYHLYIEISFLRPEGIIISISVFQGLDDDDEKNQLFRLEWDDYNDMQLMHPQPHWHFNVNKILDKSVKEYAELLDDDKVVDIFIKEKKESIVDFSSFHYAMIGDWFNTKTHIHRIRDEKGISMWFGGLLGYLKQELDYLDKKRRYQY